ncbi:hypothetical protein KV01_001725 [Salmonella enterica subsp. enterica]|nr:hypothetical protein [Salmonella enterica subsp. enterica]HAF1584459.1 hypothetical protein [Salmonella enterica]
MQPETQSSALPAYRFSIAPMVQRDNTDGYYLNIGRNSGQIREINQPASGSPENLIRYPGYLFCQFRLTGTLVEGRYGFIFYSTM